MKHLGFFALAAAMVLPACVSNPSSGGSSDKPAVTDSRPCMTNFESSGSFLSGRQFRTFEDFPQQSQSAAFDSLVPAVSAGGYQILNSSKDAGIISAAQAVSFSRGAQTTPMNVAIRKTAQSGVRVEVVFSLAGGMAASTETIQKEFCRILAAVPQGSGGNSSSASDHASTNGGALPPGVFPMTEAQQAGLKNALARKPGKTALDLAIKDATPRVADILRLHACWFPSEVTHSLNNPLEIYGAPGSFIDGSSRGLRPTKMDYHPNNACVSVYRVQGWSMPAANALKFEVIYRSDASQETKRVNYELVRQPEGQWLLKSVF